MSDRVIDRIQKLLRLSESSNLNEAASAAGQAQRLMTEYSLSMSDVEIEAEGAEPIVDHDVLSEIKQRTPRSWQVELLNAIAHANSCRLIITANSKVSYRPDALRIYGKRRDVDSCSYLFRALSGEINRLAGEYVRTLAASRGEANSFRIGAAEIIVYRLVQARQETVRTAAESGESTALVHMRNSEKEVDEHVNRMSTGRYREGRASDAAARRAGARAGMNVDLGSADQRRLGKSPDMLEEDA